MEPITVLSPHRDDAIFSVGLSLQKWSAEGRAVSILNFFTVSAYAPRVPETDGRSITRIRKREDRRALRSIGAGIRVIDAGLVDAPLRLGIKLDEICTGAAHKLIKQEEIVIARTLIERYAKASLVVAPLALGDHVDHLVVHRAAVAAASANRFGFYEDLPYGTWTRESEMISRVQQTANQLRTPLRPNLMKVEHAVRRKERHVLNYQSQITSLEGKSIARFSARYSGERVWVPARTRRWTWL